MYKKWCLFLALLCLFTQCILLNASAQSARDTNLQAAFEKGTLALRETQWHDSLLGYKLRIPIAFYEEVIKSPPEGGMVEFSSDGKWVTVTLAAEAAPLAKAYSFSPDGSKIICMDEDYVYVAGGKTITLVQPNYERGVPDAYGSFARFAKMPPSQWVGSEGVTWSPDGRYAALTNYKQILINMRLIYGLYIIDTYNGDMYCADTYPSKPFEGASVLQTCFDASGKYLYYTLYGKSYEDSLVSLMRYDMQTGEKQRLYPCQRFAAYPKLQRDSKGRLINLLDSFRANEFAGLSVFEEKDEKWSYAPFELSQPGIVIHPNYMEIGISDMGVMLHSLRFLDKAYTMAGRFFADENFTGYDELLLIEGNDAQQATVLPLSAYGDGSELAEKILSGEVLQCLNVKLSPDGYYALLLMLNSQDRTFSFLMMDMETLELQKVQTPPGAASMHAGNGTPFSNAYPSGYNWFEGNKVVILTEDGLKLYEFAY